MTTPGDTIIDGIKPDQLVLDNPSTKTNGNDVSVLVQALDSTTINDAGKNKFKTKNPRLPYEGPLIPLIDRFIDEPRPLRVAVIGGGLTGILAGILLPEKVPGINLTIYDKNDDFGGTWAENKYPGVRCDIPSHVYQSTFAPKKDWSDQFSFGSEILAYWRGVAQNYNVYRYAKFNHKIEGAEWNRERGIWTLNFTDSTGGTSTQGTAEADVVLTALGRFNAWKLPDYPGLSDFTGHLRHVQNFDPSYHVSGKKVAVIGNGASGIQLVANLQKVVGHLDHYARRPTWIATSWAGDDRTFEPQPISEEQKKAFGEDDGEYLKYRKEQEDKYWRRFETFLPGAGNDELRERFVGIMTERLQKKPHLIEQTIPDFSPNCRRLTPGPGYLEALAEEHVDYITTPIRRITATGIETEDGVHRAVDAIFCATGSNRDMVPVFSIKADGGQDLRDLWSQDGPHGFPYSYQGIATPGYPNLFFLQGPNATGPSGTVPHSAETQLAHVAKILRKISREGIKSITPSIRATDDFIDFCDAFFARSVLANGCSSWYNGGRPGARIHGLWPGSAAHLTIVRRNPRWEDWEYEYLDESGGNRFLWYFGNGSTRKEKDPESDMTPYLRRSGEVDLRDVHESWWSWP